LNGLRLIADDLTGALDSACAFANEGAPVCIGLPGRRVPEGRKVAISTESRSMSAVDAWHATTQAVLALRSSQPNMLWFKKIDSVMRGHPFLEIKVVFETGGFDACVFAPAYPDMSRVTRAGRQFVVEEGANERAVGPKFSEAFERLGIVVAADGEVASVGPSILCLDAGNQQQLVERVRRVRQALSGSQTLWAGAGGLAAALANEAATRQYPPIAGVVVGTTHPATARQIGHAMATGNLGSLEDCGGAPTWLLAPTHVPNASETETLLRASIAQIDIADRGAKSILVAGGDTLSIVASVVGAEFLECCGEAAKGVPLSRIRGGRWDGLSILSKSGGFGAPDLLAQLIADCTLE
jgi:uncharacterized protein YgbK (DUF1537 family)